MNDSSDNRTPEEILSERSEWSNGRMQQVLDSIPAPVFYKDRDGVYRGCNTAFCDFIGLSREEIIGQSVYGVAPQELAEVYHRADLELMEAGGVQIYEARVRFADGTDRDVMFHKAVMASPAGEVEGLVGVMLDISSRKQLEDQVLTISRGVAPQAGESLFVPLVQHLSEALGADVALVGMHDPDDPMKVCTRAVWADGAVAENICYALPGTPCEKVTTEGVCSFPEGVQELFPRDVLLSEMAIEAYVGAPLIDSQGNALGILVVLFREPLESLGHIETLLKIFASRASAELDLIKRDEALLDSERRLRAIFENTFVLSGILSPEGVLLRANRTSLEMIGRSEEQVIGKPFWETPWWDHSPELAATLRESIGKAAAGEQVGFVATFKDRFGEERLVQFSLKPVIEEGRVVYIVPEGYDVTDLKQIESALRESEERFRSIFDTSPDAMLLVQPEESEIVGVNQGFCNLTGYGHADVVGKGSLELGLWKDPSDRDEMYRKIAEQGEVNNLEAEFSLRDGSTRLGLLSVRPVSISGETLLLFVVRDVTDLKATEHALRESEDRYQAFVANSTEGIFRADLDPPMPLDLPFFEQVEYIIEHVKVSECNEEFARIYGFDSAQEMLGRYSMEYYDPDSIRGVVTAFIERDFRVSDYETLQYDREGRQVWLATSLVGTVEEGRLVRVWGTRRDVTERRQQMESLEYMANHDSLTGLPNRYWLKRTAEEALERRRNQGDRLALLLIDLDRFKDVNDSLGHHAGDSLLKQLGLRLERFVKGQRCHLVRLGGDEFAVLIPVYGDAGVPKRLASELLQLIKQPFEIEGLHVEIGASVGISNFPEHGDDVSTLLRCADVAMYQAKGDVRGYRAYDPESDPHSADRMELLSELGHAIRSGHMVLHYQPKVDLRSEELVGFEALVRWQHPTRGLLPPAEFIPYAELGSLIVPLTHDVLEQAIEQWREWVDSGFNVGMAINLSPRMLIDEELVNVVERLVRKHQVFPGSIEFELTETALFHDPEHAETVMKRFNAMGIRLSIDDFGTGYSSLSLLKKLPLHMLKIDRGFVSQMVRSEVDMNLVKSTINLAHNLGLGVVAEGVEDAGTLEALVELGCDEAQGFHVARPLAESQVRPWFERSRWKI